MVKLADAETMIQLAAGLNAAYFTFKGTNLPFFSNSKQLFSDLQDAKTSVDANKKRIHHDIDFCLRRYEKFMSDQENPLTFYEHILYFSGFFVFALCVIYLWIASLYPEKILPACLVIAIFAIAYLPIGVGLILEIKTRIQFNCIRSKAIKVRTSAYLHLKPPGKTA